MKLNIEKYVEIYHYLYMKVGKCYAQHHPQRILKNIAMSLI